MLVSSLLVFYFNPRLIMQDTTMVINVTLKATPEASINNLPEFIQYLTFTQRAIRIYYFHNN